MGISTDTLVKVGCCMFHNVSTAHKRLKPPFSKRCISHYRGNDMLSYSGLSAHVLHDHTPIFFTARRA